MSRATSANRQRRAHVRRSSLSAERSYANTTTGRTKVLSGVDLRSTKQKIEDLQNELNDDLKVTKRNRNSMFFIRFSLHLARKTFRIARSSSNLHSIRIWRRFKRKRSSFSSFS